MCRLLQKITLSICNALNFILGIGISVLSLVVTGLLLGSFGLYQESFAITADEINEKTRNQ